MLYGWCLLGKKPWADFDPSSSAARPILERRDEVNHGRARYRLLLACVVKKRLPMRSSSINS